MIIFNKILIFKVAITEMYPWIPWELVADPLGSAQHTLETTDLGYGLMTKGLELE
jgi:hypothetical protein